MSLDDKAVAPAGRSRSRKIATAKSGSAAKARCAARDVRGLPAKSDQSFSGSIDCGTEMGAARDSRTSA